MSPAPPRLPRVLLLLARLAALRWWNRARGTMALAFRRRGAPADRRATPRKATGSTVAFALFGAILLLQGLFFSTMTVDRLAEEVVRHETPVAGNGPTLRWAESALPGPHLWPGREHERTMTGALGLLLTWLCLALFFTGLGGRSADLAQAGWGLEWLFTLPVGARPLFLAKAGEYAATDLFGWFTAFPFLVTVYAAAGGGWGSVPAAVAGAFFLNAMTGSARLVCETWLRRRCSPALLKNVQATCTVAGMTLLFALFLVAYRGAYPGWALDLARELPRALHAQPLALPALAATAPLAAAAMAALVALVPLGGASLCARQVRAGLVTASGAPAGRRGTAPPPRPPRIRGMAGKELRLLLRDRNFLVQTTVVPLLVVGMQAVVNPQLFAGAGEARFAAVLAFGVGAYVLAFGGLSVLSVEVPALWLLFTLPRPLHAVLRGKALLWGGVASLYAAGVLIAAWRPGDAPLGRAALDTLLALCGVPLFALLASGLGALGTDPFERENYRRVRPEYSLLYMLLAGMFGFALWTEDLWTKLAVAVLVAFLAWAVWDRLRERLPLVLDPTASPAPRIALSDGLVAVLVFFQLQLVGFAVAGWWGGSGAGFVVAYLVAGCVTFLLTLYALWRLRLPAPLHALGLRRAPGAPHGAGRSLAAGAVAGLLAAGAARLYLLGVARVEPLRVRLEEAPRFTRLGEAGWSAVALLAVLLAPLFEEFLFRGLVYRGLRDRARPAAAAAGSAAVFAIVHPPISFLPVFGLGLAAAWAYERTRLLWAPVLAHALYNASLVVWPP